MVSRFPPTLFKIRFSATPYHWPMIPENNPATEPKQVKINGKQGARPQQHSGKNHSTLQGEYAKMGRGGDEVFLKKNEIFLINSFYKLDNFPVMEKIFTFSKLYFYSDIIMVFTALISGLIILLRGNKYKLISIYPLGSAAATIIFYIFILNLKLRTHPLMDITVFIFLKIEYTTLAVVFYKRCKNKTTERIILITSLLYAIYSIAEVTTIITKNRSIGLNFFAQNIFILTISISIIYSLFKEKIITKIKQDTPIIIALGSIAFSVCTLPFYIAWDTISYNEQYQLDPIFCLNNFYYSIFFTITLFSILWQKQEKSYIS